MAYQRSQMLYDDGKYYKWTARADHDNPLYIQGKDHREMNKTEGYEVLRFINSFVNSVTWSNGTPGLAENQKVEKMIRHDVPSHIRTHAQKQEWILNNWKNVT